MHPAHPREQLRATREPQPAHTLQRTAAQGSRMSTHREPPGVLGIWSMGTLQGEARERSLPATYPEAGSLPRKWCLHICPSHPGRWTPLSPWRAGWGGTWPGMFRAGGMDSLRPDLWLPCGHSAHVLGLLSIRHQDAAPSPGSELLLGSTPAPHASRVLPREGKAWDRDASHSPPFPLIFE